MIKYPGKSHSIHCQHLNRKVVSFAKLASSAAAVSSNSANAGLMRFGGRAEFISTEVDWSPL